MISMPKRATKAHLTARINARLLERLYQYAEKIGRTRSEIVDRALEEYLAREAPEAPPSPKPARPRPPRKS